jgi:hypothetical protein
MEPGAHRELPRHFALDIAGRGTLTADSLFTFSQLTLVRLAQHLESRGVIVRVVTIQGL